MYFQSSLVNMLFYEGLGQERLRQILIPGDNGPVSTRFSELFDEGPGLLGILEHQVPFQLIFHTPNDVLRMRCSGKFFPVYHLFY